MMTDKSRIHWFKDIGYRHVPIGTAQIRQNVEVAKREFLLNMMGSALKIVCQNGSSSLKMHKREIGTSDGARNSI